MPAIATTDDIVAEMKRAARMAARFLPVEQIGTFLSQPYSSSLCLRLRGGILSLMGYFYDMVLSADSNGGQDFRRLS
jgi:hypothetical protein